MIVSYSDMFVILDTCIDGEEKKGCQSMAEPAEEAPSSIYNTPEECWHQPPKNPKHQEVHVLLSRGSTFPMRNTWVKEESWKNTKTPTDTFLQQKK